MLVLARLLSCSLVLLLLNMPMLCASGSHPRKPPRPPNEDSSSGIDKSAYALGKKMYRARGVPAKVDEDLKKTQGPVLNDLQKKLTDKKIKASIDKLAGRINAEQLKALRYYIKTRYKVE